MNEFLEAFSEAFSHYRIVLYYDGAGWQKSKTLVFLANIQTLLLPPYSRELNPKEHI